MKPKRPAIKLWAFPASLALSLAGCTAAQAPADSLDQQTVAAPFREPDVRYEPSPHRVVQAMLQLAEVKESDVVYDLGSGDGRIPIAAARDYGARAFGIDIDPRLIARANANARKANVADRVTFLNRDLFEADVSEATVVTLFLSPDVNLKLRPKLLTELRPGTRVVSHWHNMGDWQPDRTITVLERPIYLWTIPGALP